MSAISEILNKYRSELLEDWLSEMTGSIRRSDLMGTDELRQQAVHFLDLLQLGANASTDGDLSGPAWQDMRELLIDISRSRAAQGFTASETARFVLSFKKPLFARLRRESKDADGLASQTWEANNMLDNIGLYTTEVFLKSREAIIQRQQQDMLELSTPVVKLWEGILALPLIGTLDSARTQIVMESLLQQIVNTGSRVAIIDITGVPTVDTLVAQHLLKTVTAARLMGADCIISGIRPQIAQTIVHLGVGLGDVITKATLADAFVVALQRTGSTISKTQR
ncbi:MAG TPA: STAS domain-containing protein [Terriglobales bacterium]|nr:STAS domain-containing protein [Terriglobales bacterium]